MSLRIAFIAQRWDYGDPARGPSFEDSAFRTGLEGMGHDVHCYDFVARAKSIGSAAMNIELTDFVRALKPDLAFFFLFKDEIRAETIAALTRSGITTFNWFADDHWRFESFSRFFAPAFSLVSTTDPAAIPKYAQIGCTDVVLTQWATNLPRAVIPRREQYDVTFVGQHYGDRPKLVKALKSAGIDVRCFGFGWDAGRLTQDAMLSLFAASRINLNFSSGYRGRLWRRRPPTNQIKARIFEVVGTGGFLLTERTAALEKYFEVEREVSAFDGADDLVAKTRYWLEHDDARRRAADAACRRTASEHTYAHRFEEIFRAAGL